MSKHLYTHRKTSYQSASIPQHLSFQPRPFMVQPQTEEQSEQPDIKTALQRAERYGHRLDRIKFGAPPVQRSEPRIVQAKLTIGEPGDKYEQEADRVAAQVVNSIHTPSSQPSEPSQAVQRQDEPVEEIQAKPEITALQRQDEPVEEIQAKLSISDLGRSPVQTQVQREAKPEDEELQTKSILQRREAAGGGEASMDVESAINSAKGGGQPLEAGLQRSMGQAMGADFSHVKVHTDAQADQLNQSIQAKAFTTGQDVFFRSGEYNPGSRGGQELIAHELTHVVQQNGGAVHRTRLPKKAAKYTASFSTTNDFEQTHGAKNPEEAKKKGDQRQDGGEVLHYMDLQQIRNIDIDYTRQFAANLEQDLFTRPQPHEGVNNYWTEGKYNIWEYDRKKKKVSARKAQLCLGLINFHVNEAAGTVKIGIHHINGVR